MSTKIRDKASGFFVENDSTYRHSEIDVLSPRAIALGAAPMLAVFCPVQTCKAIVDQGVDIPVSDGENATSPPTVAAVGPASGHMFFPSERARPASAIAGMNFNFRFINEFHCRRRCCVTECWAASVIRRRTGFSVLNGFSKRKKPYRGR
jgi:hypothetical protein